MLTNLSCLFAWPKIVSTIFLVGVEGGGEAQDSHSLEVLDSQKGIPKGLKNPEIP